MKEMLAGIKLAMLGGDAREIVLMRGLIQQGAEVKALGLSNLSKKESSSSYHAFLAELPKAEAVILPVRGIDHQSIIYAPQIQSPLYFTQELAKAIPAGTPVLVGIANNLLKRMAAAYNWQLIETANIDEIAILNAIPTAEGALMLAMQELPITLHGSEAFVLGLGRTGFVLARLLAKVGSKVTAIDRGPADRARAYSEGWAAYSFNELAAIAEQADVIFNTVPALVLTENILFRTKPGVVVVDLASKPGGTDFEAAAALGRRAILAPGLPGKIAPRTAGRILARTYPAIILECLQRQTLCGGAGDVIER